MVSGRWRQQRRQRETAVEQQLVPERANPRPAHSAPVATSGSQLPVHPCPVTLWLLLHLPCTLQNGVCNSRPDVVSMNRTVIDRTACDQQSAAQHSIPKLAQMILGVEGFR